MKLQYYFIYKPFGMLSQFTVEVAGQQTLAHLPFVFPKDIYPVGRLDADSEGLLLLTNDKSLNKKYLHPLYHLTKTYWAQVEGVPQAWQLQQLQEGVAIRIHGKLYRTLPAEVELLTPPPDLPPRTPPVRFRKTVPDAWLKIKLTEGKNRQVRKMCAAVGLPVLRLVRVGFGAFVWGLPPLEQLQVAEVRAVSVNWFR